jgi:hypothetical protein
MHRVPGCDHAAGVLRTFSVSLCSKNTSILGLFGEDEKCRATMKDERHLMDLEPLAALNT